MNLKEWAKIWQIVRQWVCKAERLQECETELAFYKPKYRFTDMRGISGELLGAMIRDAFPHIGFYQPLESVYDVPHYEELHEWLQTDLLNKREWREKWDCNKFAFASYFLIHEIGRLQDLNLPYGVAFGYATPGDPNSYHAYNVACVLNANMAHRIVLVEPQNDRIQHEFEYDTRGILL